MAEYTHVGPGLPPLHGARANALIFGSFPQPQKPGAGLFLRPQAEPLLADDRRRDR